MHVDSRDGASARCLAARARADQRQAVMEGWERQARESVEAARAEVTRTTDAAVAEHVRNTAARVRARVPAFVAWMDGGCERPFPVLHPLPWPPDALCNALRLVEHAELELERCAAARGRLNEVEAQRAAQAARRAAQAAREQAALANARVQQAGTVSGVGVLGRGADA